MPNWRKLLRIAYGLLDGHGLVSQASFGGGTALALRYDHRLSWDIDIFLPDPQYLGLLSPRLNEQASEAIESVGGSYTEQTNFLKLALPEGEIDFIVAPLLTQPGVKSHRLEGYDVLVEEPEEIIAKKLTYRGGNFLKIRDVFDMITVNATTPALFHAAIKSARFDREATQGRILELARTYRVDLQDAVTPTAKGQGYMGLPASALASAMGVHRSPLRD